MFDICSNMFRYAAMHDVGISLLIMCTEHIVITKVFTNLPCSAVNSCAVLSAYNTESFLYQPTGVLLWFMVEVALGEFNDLPMEIFDDLFHET